MFVDLHMHEHTFSGDSHLSLEEITARAKQLGLDAVCITDHDSMGLREIARQYSAQIGFPIFTGIEFYSLQGDIVAFGIQDYPRKRVSAQTFIDCVKAQGGVCFSAHPFRNNNRGLAAALDTVTGLDGVEVLNGSTLPDANQAAANRAISLHLAQLGASDCHIREKVGVYATWFPDEIHTEAELVSAIWAHRCKPAYYQDGEYHIWNPEKKTFYQAGVTSHRTVEYSEVHSA